jgi:hypothetical protein
MFLRLSLLIACISCATAATCPIDNFIGNWTGTCVQAVGMTSACSTVEGCAIAGSAGMSLAHGWDTNTSLSSCTQTYKFSFFKVGNTIMYEYTSGDLVGSCSNAVPPHANLFAFLQHGPPSQQSFSAAGVDGAPSSFFGSDIPCYIAAGATPPTSATALTFLASASADGTRYREYGSYDSAFAYQSPNADNHPHLFNASALATPSSSWSMFGKMYSNAAISARPAGSPPLINSTLLASTNVPVFSYKCTAVKSIPVNPGSPPTSTKSSSESACMTLPLLVLAMLVATFMG